MHRSCRRISTANTARLYCSPSTRFFSDALSQAQRQPQQLLQSQLYYAIFYLYAHINWYVAVVGCRGERLIENMASLCNARLKCLGVLGNVNLLCKQPFGLIVLARLIMGITIMHIFVAIHQWMDIQIFYILTRPLASVAFRSSTEMPSVTMCCRTFLINSSSWLREARNSVVISGIDLGAFVTVNRCFPVDGDAVLHIFDRLLKWARHVVFFF